MGFDISRMIKAGKEVDPAIMIGYNCRGYPPPNADLALHHSEKVPGKPYIESEGTMTDYWGAYSKEQGLYGYTNVGFCMAAECSAQPSSRRKWYIL
jgi:hypothetical protein